MEKIIISALILALVFAPSLTLASPGLLDQYGGHICLKDCLAYGLTNGQYHYHDLPNTPNYFTGDLARPNQSYIFYQPLLEPYEITTEYDSLNANETELNALVKSTENDKYYCKDKEVFGAGLYDGLNRARIRPMCAESESLVLANAKIEPQNYYKEILVTTSKINKVYHFEIRKDNKNVFTDFVPIDELKGLFLKGETDSTLYYINRYDDPLSLRPVSAEKAQFYGGANYQDYIVRVADSLIFSYKIGQPIY
jgi:hypothetical protein